jgi:hypothetical protein
MTLMLARLGAPRPAPEPSSGAERVNAGADRVLGGYGQLHGAAAPVQLPPRAHGPAADPPGAERLGMSAAETAFFKTCARPSPPRTGSRMMAAIWWLPYGGCHMMAAI